ncbi:uncharacterized protein ATNIH1004_009718 [Aspergillus tanneri]|uniref:Major facilitator superfamily (MFS) profile domain-containing protein n=1 Tax=Aspergillus tanneri TaxID=1220188 RepID=A0A5M9MBA6_9EURO|nr:uncharacterized protein ATNIH1004_009718 [Aspergillus tanneri]KAA8642956.1 hypothetical protein ATNIH1004_009718 [Aspergillus tanneri]
MYANEGTVAVVLPEQTRDHHKSQPDDSDSKLEGAEEVLSEYPDGGQRAWLVVLGVWCALFPTFGIMNITGILEEWLAEDQLQGHSKASISWIFSIYNFLFWLGGIQFILSFSILGGLSSSAVLTPTLGTINHWFLKRRGLATGVATTSGGIGGIVWSAIFGALQDNLGFPWIVRILGFMSIGCFAVSLLLMETRLPPNKSAGGTIDIRSLREVRFTIASIAVSFAEVGLMIMITYLPAYAASHGVTGALSYNLMSIFSATLIFGRVIPGLLADRWGRYNVMTVTGGVSMLLVLALWMKAGEDTAAIVTFAAFYGFWSSPAVGLSPVCIAQISRTEDYGKRYGTTTAIFGLSILVAIPVAGEILKAQNPASGQETNYTGLIVFCGASYAFSTVLLVVTKVISVGWSVTRVF